MSNSRQHVVEPARQQQAGRPASRQMAPLHLLTNIHAHTRINVQLQQLPGWRAARSSPGLVARRQHDSVRGFTDQLRHIVVID